MKTPSPANTARSARPFAALLSAWFRLPALLLAGLGLLAPAALRAAQYFQDFSASAVGATTFSDGSTLSSDRLGTVAMVQDATIKELALTASGTVNTRSAFKLPDLDPGSPVQAFSARWNSQVYGDFPNAADGFSFNFGQLGSTDLVNATATQEDGYGTGLSFGVRTFVANDPGFYLRVNGSVVASAAYDPAVQWGIFNGTRHLFEVDWNRNTGLTVRVDGNPVFTNVATPGFTPQAGDRFVWAARCGGGFAEEVRLDNVLVMTGGNLVRVATTAPYFKDGENPPSQTADKAFDGDLNTKWLTFSDPAGFIGATVSGSRSVRAYALSSAEDFAERDPLTWTFEGSGNGGSSWSPAGSGGGHFVNRHETRFWAGTSASTFGAFRLNIAANNGGTEIQLAELALYEFSPVRLVTVADEAGLRAALTGQQAGDTIRFASDITLTTGDLPAVQQGIVIDGNGHTLDGNNQFRGLFVVSFVPGTATFQNVSVAIRNLTIQHAQARGGNGGINAGGGAGLGGALFVGNLATVSVNNLQVIANNATGGSGGPAITGSGAGGGLGGNGGNNGGNLGGGGGAIGAGAPNGSFGGGSGGLGGAVFVMQGGVLNVSGPLTLHDSTVAAGAGSGAGSPGSAFGSGIFINGTGTVTFAPDTGETATVSDEIADQTGNGGTAGNAGTASLVKNGAGTLVLGGANTYTGTTTVNAGTLRVNGSLASGAVTVASGTTLGGTGTIGGTATIDGTLSPGASIGTLTFGTDLTLPADSTTHLELDKSVPTNDVVRVLGTVTYGGTLEVVNLAGTFADGDSFRIFDATGYAGAFGTITLPALPPTLRWVTDGLAVDGTLAVASTTLTVTDEATLRAALTTATDGYTISFAADITLTTGDLPVVQHALTIAGNGHTLDGNNQFRGLFVASFVPGTATFQNVNVAIQDLTIQNARAQGGHGGYNAGGGAGLGGALFVGNLATVDASNLQVRTNSAAGGDGGAPLGIAGGGGGLGGNGAPAGGGGGVGTGADGGEGTGNGAPGIVLGAAPGGDAASSVGGVHGGGGAADAGQGAGGGVGGGDLSTKAGGFGGGGGGTIPAGAGGFGGGGGAVQPGGFGGGGGVSAIGGFGGGDGAGLGGAIFVMEGGVLNLTGPLSLHDGTVNGGSEGGNGFPGSAFGSGLFLQGNTSVTFAPDTGETQTIADAIADQTGSGGLGGDAGTGSLVKQGAGTLVLAAANTYTGTTTVSAGLLRVDGSIGTGAVTVTDDGTLGGTGTIGGPVTLGGVLSPGAGIGTLTFSSAPLLTTALTYLELNSSSHTNDVVRVLAPLTYGGALEVVNLGGAFTAGDSFPIFDATGYSGAFISLTLPALPAGLGWDTTGLTTDGTLRVVTVNIAPVAGTDTVTRVKGRTVKVLMSELLANDTDADGPSALSITAVGPASANGATVHLVGGFVVYEANAPAPNTDAPDSFTYTVSDGVDTATGTVTVTVAEPETPTQNVTGTLLTGPSGSEQMQVGAAGIPGRSYVLQITDSLTSPVTWTDLGPAQAAPANGQLQFNDPSPESPRFYRVIEQ